MYFVQFKLLFHGLVCHQLLPLFLSLLPESRLLYFHSFAQSLLDLASTEVVHKLCNHQPIRVKLSEYQLRRPNKLTFDNFSFFVNIKKHFLRESRTGSFKFEGNLIIESKITIKTWCCNIRHQYRSKFISLLDNLYS